MVQLPSEIFNSASSPAHWHARAGELADWTLARLVCRNDCYGSYRPAHEIGKEYTRPDGSKGVLGPQTTVHRELTRGLLIRHYRATDRAHVIGAHTADQNNRSKSGGLDLDYHGDGSTPPDVNLRAGIHWHDVLARKGFRPLLTDSNGKGGFHLRVLLAESIDAARIFHFFHALTADHKQLGFPSPPEQFPKQRDVRRCEKRLGNWLRLPGRHHSREHWSRVWDGRRWLEGNAAIDLMLTLTGDAPCLVPDAPPPEAAVTRSLRVRAYTRGGNLPARIAAYMRKLPHLGEGQGRDDVAFCFAAWLTRDMGASDDIALGWLVQWDEGNHPPKGEDRLKEILANADLYAGSPKGCGRPAPSTEVDRQGHRILRAIAEVWR